MTTTTSPCRIANLAGRFRAAMGRLSDRAHASGDARAQAMAWTTTQTPGPLGLAGRVCRDPRFDALRRPT
jgi:hypothetical protein